MLFQESDEFNSRLEEAWCKQLRHDFNVRNIEQFAALMASPEGRVALETVGVPIDELREQTDQAIHQVWGVSLSEPLQAGESREEGGAVSLLTTKRLAFGLELGRKDRFKDLAFGSELPPPDGADGPSERKSKQQGWFPYTPDPLPPEFFLLKAFPRARDQVQRGTCAAFTVTAAWELMARHLKQDPLNLSPQFVYYWCKSLDGSERSDGTSLGWALHVLKERGACREEFCEYNGYHDFGQSYLYDHTPDQDGRDRAMKDARGHRISKATAVSARSKDALKRALASGRPVAVGVPIFKTAWTGGYTWHRGEVQMPLVAREPGGKERILDERLGSHAICLVGYRDNDPDHPESARPGGGFFAFRNSWGTDWGRAPERPLASGYGVLPYAYIERYGLDAHVIDDLMIDGKAILPAEAAKGAAPAGGEAKRPKAAKARRKRR
jgi:hypothetical protein